MPLVLETSKNSLIDSDRFVAPCFDTDMIVTEEAKQSESENSSLLVLISLGNADPVHFSTFTECCALFSHLHFSSLTDSCAPFSFFISVVSQTAVPSSHIFSADCYGLCSDYWW